MKDCQFFSHKASIFNHLEQKCQHTLESEDPTKLLLVETGSDELIFTDLTINVLENFLLMNTNSN